MKNVTIGGKQYKDIFNKIDSELANTLLIIRKFSIWDGNYSALCVTIKQHVTISL